MIEPMYQTISYCSALEFANKKLGRYANAIYLHSARLHPELARYSFIGFSPFREFLSVTHGLDNSMAVLNQLEEALAAWQLSTIPGLPPFQGGLAGYFSYDLIRTFEALPNHALNDIPVPRIAVCAYDLVLSMDHFSKQAWIISSGLPECQTAMRLRRAQERLNWAFQEIMHPVTIIPSDVALDLEEISSNFMPDSYCKAVEKAMEYIRNGDIFEVNLSQCFSCKLPKGISALQLFQRLLHYNPAPFASFIAIGDLTIISSSPERFIKIEGEEIETRPIKGTIRRSSNLQEDKKLAHCLLNSEKDRAENAMIVDLMRNDLSKICRPHSIKVEKFCGLESFETVHHLVSVIKGRLKENIHLKEMLQAVIPGGSVTGAPKIRAMEIIDELEPTRRGPYCGNAFYYGFNGAFDSSILIRTFVFFQDILRFSAGGAVVLDSNPELEYEETKVKSGALIKALTTPISGFS